MKKAPIQYGKSYLYTETDGMDLTYFIDYQCRIIVRAIRGFLDTYQKIRRDIEAFDRWLWDSGLYRQLNDKQRMLFNIAKDDHHQRFRANTLILRAQHHWNGMAWVFPDLLLQPSTQTVLAIAWTLGGMALTWQANRLGKRKLWVFGAVLLGAVVLKLFVVDFAASGTVARIVSFLSVGVLLLFIGYLAPLPPAEQAIDKSTD